MPDASDAMLHLRPLLILLVSEVYDGSEQEHVARRKLWVRAVAVERAAQVLRNLAADRQIVSVGLEQDGAKLPVRKGWSGKGWLMIYVSHRRVQLWGGAGISLFIRT